jgi:hypothetical protein
VPWVRGKAAGRVWRHFAFACRPQAAGVSRGKGEIQSRSIRHRRDVRPSCTTLSFHDARDTAPQPAKRWRHSVHGVIERHPLGERQCAH